MELLRNVALLPIAMHIPDNFLNIGTSVVCWLITAGLLFFALRNTQRSLGERQVPLMGVMAAFIFAAQMINFPVLGGTSGHLLGGALAALVLGPWPAMLVMSAVIAVQGLLFQDGGLVVMGANILNMGLLTALVGFGIGRAFEGRSRGLRLAGAAIAAWLSVMTAALSTALQLWLSGTARLDIVIPAMLGVHTLIGLGEAAITVAAMAFILRTRPDLVEQNAAKQRGGAWVLVGFIIAAAVAFISPLASADPDGLERVAENLGFSGQAGSAPYKIFQDYTLPFLGNTPLSTIAAGLIGVLVVGTLVMLVGRAVRRPTSDSASA